MGVGAIPRWVPGYPRRCEGWGSVSSPGNGARGPGAIVIGVHGRQSIEEGLPGLDGTVRELEAPSGARCRLGLHLARLQLRGGVPRYPLVKHHRPEILSV